MCPRECSGDKIGRIITDTGIGYYYCKECGAEFGQYNFIDPIPLLGLIRTAQQKLDREISENQPYAGRECSCLLLRLVDQRDILEKIECYLLGNDKPLKRLITDLSSSEE